MIFWATIAAAALFAALLLVRPMLLSRRAAAPRAAHDVQVFRDQLSAVDRDLDRGVLTGAEAEGARTEISRRLLTAADEAERETGASPAPPALSRSVAIVAAVLIAGASLGLYTQLGAPGLRDLPLAERLADMRRATADRPDQATAERLIAEGRAERGEADPALDIPAETLVLIDQLREVVASRPDDVRGRRLLANALLGTGRPAEARVIFDELITLLGDAATAEDFSAAAEAMILAAGGYVSPQAESALGRTLQMNPEHPSARYYAGLSLAQNGRPDLALSVWRRLLSEGPEDAPWIAPIRAQIGELAAMAGQAPPGPDSDDIEAAGEMTPEERQEMIAGMIARLEDRLATEGGSASEWARLIRAYGVQGRAGDAARIWADAQETFAAEPEALAIIRTEAIAAGVAE